MLHYFTIGCYIILTSVMVSLLAYIHGVQLDSKLYQRTKCLNILKWDTTGKTFSEHQVKQTLSIKLLDLLITLTHKRMSCGNRATLKNWQFVKQKYLYPSICIFDHHRLLTVTFRLGDATSRKICWPCFWNFLLARTRRINSNKNFIIRVCN